MTPPVRRALLSVHDKRGIADLAAALNRLGVEIVSTGSTARTVADAGVPVVEVAEVTGAGEMLDGRVKSLHPAIHGGILADRSKPDHLDELDRRGIAPIDLVVCNLYPFAETVASGASAAEVVEMIDIGGPAMVRAAAKNHAAVGVVVDPADYGPVVEELRAGGALTDPTRQRLAAKAFAATAAYDAAVAAWFDRGERFPEVFVPVYARVQRLRYGENPHQGAAYYREASGTPWGLASAVQHHGKELSYNNLLDTDAAWGLVAGFDGPCVAIIKHTNPAGCAVADDLATAYEAALAGDPVSAFGGIVAANRRVDRATAEQIVEVFTEVVVAPGYDPGALDVLRGKRNLRVLEVTRPAAIIAGHGEVAGPVTVRSVQGGLLVQDADTGPDTPDEWKVATAAQPDPETLADLRFAWRVCRHVKSNAIVLARSRHVVGVGAGQMSRVDAVRLAVEKSAGRAGGAVLASDAFFPFRDGIDAAAAAGVVAVVQPGGSVRDDEVVAAADEHGIAMLLTGRRHFRH